MFDHVVVGAGFAGAVFARKCASLGGRVLLIEKRNHIGGNCYDYFDKRGIIVHRYGPHLFHTSNAEVFAYLSRFTRWREYQHRVLAQVDGREVPLPFNLNSLHMLFPAGMADSLERRLIDCFGFGVKVPILELKKQEDRQLRQLADYIYEKIFVNYTAKQWSCSPEKISGEVMGRVPVFISRDDRYFHDTYQVVPKHGYTGLFTNLLDHPRIHLLLNTDFRDVVSLKPEGGTVSLFGRPFSGKLVFTGMIDSLFDCCFGPLPYRSLRFDFESLEIDSFQRAAVVNYPNNFDFTRITEFKKICGRCTAGTTILREFPRDFDPDPEKKQTPCYPIFKRDNIRRYERYKELAERFPDLILVGRLAEYRYYDMDDIVERVLTVFSELF